MADAFAPDRFLFCFSNDRKTLPFVDARGAEQPRDPQVSL
jgi:hypothetical protein